MIEIKHLKKIYPNATPLNDVSTVINDGDIISVIGPSGTGKSTLIRCIDMLDKPTSGEIIVDGETITAPGYDVSAVRKKMGMVFQSFNLFGHLTVAENVMMAPMDLLHMSKQDAYDKAIKLLHMVGLESRAMNYPDMLSGGQKQRVAIARTLSMDPEIILFDEPTSALDPTMVGEVQAVIRALAEMGKTMMIVTHEMKFAKEICNRVFYMDEGGIYEDGSPEQVFDHPLREKTRRFVRHLKVLEIMVDGDQFDYLGAVSLIDQYGYKNEIPAKTVYRIHVVFEELCQNILAAAITEPHIAFTVEYDGERAIAMVDYNADFDIEETENKLSLTILKNACTGIKCDKTERGGKATLNIR